MGNKAWSLIACGCHELGKRDIARRKVSRQQDNGGLNLKGGVRETLTRQPCPTALPSAYAFDVHNYEFTNYLIRNQNQRVRCMLVLVSNRFQVTERS